MCGGGGGISTPTCADDGVTIGSVVTVLMLMITIRSFVTLGFLVNDSFVDFMMHSYLLGSATTNVKVVFNTVGLLFMIQ